MFDGPGSPAAQCPTVCLYLLPLDVFTARHDVVGGYVAQLCCYHVYGERFSKNGKVSGGRGQGMNRKEGREYRK